MSDIFLQKTKNQGLGAKRRLILGAKHATVVSF